MNYTLQEQADRASEMLTGKTVRIVKRHSAREIMLELEDGTRLYVDQTADGLELSITGDEAELGVERALAWYEKNEPGFQVATEELKGISLSELRQMFGVSPDDLEDPLMFNCYEVKPNHVERLQRCVETRIDLGRFSYHVEAYQRKSGGAA